MRKRKLSLLFFLGFVFCFVQNGNSQVTFVITDFPDDTPENASVFISGDFEGWSGGQEKYKLSQDGASYFITIPEQREAINFKFTLGTWDSVEVDTNGANIDNRTYTFADKSETVIFKIQNWLKSNSLSSTASKNVSILSEKFYMPKSDINRRIWLYLPPDYATSTKRYPVIYMHDGQNIFDEKTSGFGEWQVDETLDNLFNKTGFGVIVIGIDHGGVNRIDEYTPWGNIEYGGGEGDAYLKFLVETLKPYVDTNYKTKSNKENTAIIGSSLAGLISHYAGLKHPETFGLIGAFSPTFWFSDLCYDFAAGHSIDNNSKMYFLAGDNESETMVSNLEKMIELMKANGFSLENIKSKVVIEGEHNEKLWRDNFEETILWLFNE